MFKRSKWFSLSLASIVSVSLMLSGCTGNSGISNNGTPVGSPSDSGGANQEKRKIVLSTIKNYYTTALKQVAKDYSELHPETTVEIEIIADNATYAQNFTTKMSADKKVAPDIVHTNLLGVADEGSLIAKGWLLPLDELLDEENEYNDNKKVREAIDPKYLTLAIGSTGQTTYLPFDLVGLGVYYNKTVFKQLGIEPPATFEDWFAISNQLRDAGYKSPIGASSFSNWVVLALADWAYRKDASQLVTLPGDGRYDESTMSKNKDMNYSPDDPIFDEGVVFDPEKIINYGKNINMNNPVNEKIWNTYKSLSKFFPEGFSNPDDNQTYAQFMAQKVPMYMYGSWQVGTILGDMQKLPDDKKFEWGTFKIPTFAQPDPNFPGQPRSLLVAGHKLGIAQKDDPEQYKRAADFLKYLYSPETTAKVFAITIESGEFVQGPSLVRGVQLSDEINAYLDGFKAEGNLRTEYSEFVGALKLEAETPQKTDAELKFMQDKMDWNTFAEKLTKFTGNVLDDRVKSFGYDLDPATAEKVQP